MVGPGKYANADVAGATLDGRINVAAPPPPPLNFCSLFGGTVPFDATTLESLYPSHGAFVSRFTQATDAWQTPQSAS